MSSAQAPREQQTTAYELGRLVGVVDNLSRRIESLERNTDASFGRVSETLANVAEGYARREELKAFEARVGVRLDEWTLKLARVETQGNASETALKIMHTEHKPWSRAAELALQILAAVAIGWIALKLGLGGGS